MRQTGSQHRAIPTSKGLRLAALPGGSARKLSAVPQKRSTALGTIVGAGDGPELPRVQCRPVSQRADWRTLPERIAGRAGVVPQRVRGDHDSGLFDFRWRDSSDSVVDDNLS